KENQKNFRRMLTHPQAADGTILCPRAVGKRPALPEPNAQSITNPTRHTKQSLNKKSSPAEP
ncbi:hypothetical protein, partial [uncultured Rikenella sp.]|uniref:hypothetical protein n=1 Tax=uncultured Rikenella sp. TaxID=368003 RepID=UPI00261A026D